MKLKVVKPKPKYYKISYAMLSYHLKQEEEQAVEEKPVSAPVQSKVATKFADKYDKLVDLAIKKGLVEEDERDLKKLELQSLSDDEYAQYEQEVNDAVAMKVASITDEEPKYEEGMTEAEKALARIRAKGSAPIMTDFSNNVSDDYLFDDESGSRSLSDIKQDKMMAQAMGSMEIKSETQLFEDAMGDLAKKLHGNKTTASAKSPMSNLKGLTRPIVVPQNNQFSSGNKFDKFSQLNWTLGGRV